MDWYLCLNLFYLILEFYPRNSTNGWLLYAIICVAVVNPPPPPKKNKPECPWELPWVENVSLTFDTYTWFHWFCLIRALSDVYRAHTTFIKGIGVLTNIGSDNTAFGLSRSYEIPSFLLFLYCWRLSKWWIKHCFARSLNYETIIANMRALWYGWIPLLKKKRPIQILLQVLWCEHGIKSIPCSYENALNKFSLSAV